MDGFPGGKESCGIMKDGNSAHRSAYTVKERAELGIRKIPWPARSPDLNPIENVCCVQEANKKRFRKRRPHNRREVVEVAQEKLEKPPRKRIYDMIDGIPRRGEAIINAGGERTEY